MSLIFQQQQKEKLESSNLITYKEIREILDAFQVASGQSFAIGKTRALLDYIKAGNSLVIENFKFSNKDQVVSSVIELANIYKDIDHSIDLATEKDFKQYF